MTTPDNLRQLIENLSDRTADVRAALAAEPLTPTYVLARLGRDRSVKVRRAAAGNPSMPESVLDRLSRSDDPLILDAVARNPGASVEVQFAALCRLDAIRGERRLLTEEMMAKVLAQAEAR